MSFFGVVIVILEISLRIITGLGSPPLYIHSDAYEYIQAPNQRVRRFGNLIETNELSMRSEPLRANACPTVLFLGDSVINGGAPTDQSALATSIIEQALRREGYRDVQVMNVSAGSWGPDNAVAYVRDHPQVDPDLIVGVWSSHDAGDEMTHASVAGVDPSFPDHRPLTAIGELMTRYGVPRLKDLLVRIVPSPSQPPETLVERKTRPDLVPRLNPGWMGMVEYAAGTDAPLLIYLHAEQKEAREGAYFPQGDSILALAERHGIPAVRGLAHEMEPNIYRDFIHLNSEGQRALALALLPPIERELSRAAPMCPVRQGP